MDSRTRTLQAFIVGALVAGVSLCCTWFGLFIRLGYDDVMNITFAWEPPLKELLKGLLFPFTPFYRPSGSAVYRMLFEVFGLNPLPFRISVYCLLLLNLWLLFRLVVRLQAPREVAVLSALLYSYHGRLSAIYLNNGTIYDVLCGTLMLLAVGYYVGIRKTGNFLNGGQWVCFLALFILSLNAKEMAGAVPLLLVVYEAVYHGPLARSSRRSWGAFLRQVLPAAACGVITAIAARAKTGPGSVMYSNAPYGMTLSAHQFADHWRRLMANLVYARSPEIAGSEMFIIWALMIIAVTVMRKPYIAFFAAWALCTPLPVIFIPYRGFFVMYIPLAGWAVTVAGILVDGRNWLLRLIFRRPRLSASPFKPERVLVFTAVAAFIIFFPLHDIRSERRSNDPGQPVIAGMTHDILALNEPLPDGAHVLFLHDRFPADAFGTGMIMRLLYNDRDLSADRPTMMKQPPDLDSYDRVFDYVNGRLAVVRKRPHDAAESRQLNYPE